MRTWGKGEKGEEREEREARMRVQGRKGRCTASSRAIGSSSFLPCFEPVNEGGGLINCEPRTYSISDEKSRRWDLME